jgi:hypothetical protein
MQVLSRLIVACLVLVSSAVVCAGETKELRMGMTDDDVFYVAETPQWSVKVEKLLTLRFADVNVKSKSGYPFGMMLYFKSDSPDLAQFDTPEKIAKSVRVSSEKYLPGIVEKKIELQSVPVSYGSCTVLTDADVAKKSPIPDGEYKYLTRGMVRLSKDSALGFSLMTKDVTSPDYKQLMKYVYSFVKNPSGPSVQAPPREQARATKLEGISKPAIQSPQQVQIATSKPKIDAAPPQPISKQQGTKTVRHSNANSDLRKCLDFSSNEDVIKCAGAR